ncbi:hypothetical protein Taro_035305, partial [Colocasia esculenta]|nr:hypothetical protein [Colocasia esculenta]
IRLPDYTSFPGDRIHITSSSVTCPIPFSSRGKIDPGSASRYITSLLYAHIPGPVDSSKKFPLSVRDSLFDMFMEARDKAAKIAGIQDPIAWMDYDLVWMRRTIGSPFVIVGLLDHGRRGHKRLNAIGQLIRKRMCILHHELECAPTFCELFDRTHKRKGTDDYVSESACMIVKTYDRTMADRYAKGTLQPDLDPKA